MISTLIASAACRARINQQPAWHNTKYSTRLTVYLITMATCARYLRASSWFIVGWEALRKRAPNRWGPRPLINITWNVKAYWMLKLKYAISWQPVHSWTRRNHLDSPCWFCCLCGYSNKEGMTMCKMQLWDYWNTFSVEDLSIRVQFNIWLLLLNLRITINHLTI